jgi:hypothetical protein
MAKLFIALLIALSLPRSSNATESIEVASTLSVTGCSGNKYTLVGGLYSKQQIEWMQNVFQFTYNNESIGGCEFDEFTKDKFSTSEMEVLLTNKQFHNFLGKKIVEKIVNLMNSKRLLAQNKTKLESIDDPEKICNSAAIRRYSQQQVELLKEMRRAFKIHSIDNPLAVDCD